MILVQRKLKVRLQFYLAFTWLIQDAIYLFHVPVYRKYERARSSCCFTSSRLQCCLKAFLRAATRVIFRTPGLLCNTVHIMQQSVGESMHFYASSAHCNTYLLFTIYLITYISTDICTMVFAWE